MQLYLDMDGVLMDYERHIAGWLETPWRGRTYVHLPESEWTAEEHANDLLYKAAMADRRFWTTMPPMADAHMLWSFCRPHYAHVLTATPSNATYRERCAKDKADSIRKHFDPVFPQDQFHAVLRSEKRQFAVPGAVLVDDLPQNCTEWEAKGGTAILHKDALTTIKILQEIYYAG